MNSAVASSLGIVAYLALFSGVGLVFVFANLLLGRFLRPADPHPEKLEIYECGEPAIGSSFVQFDLRFYVVALVFIIFDVEVAFLFPWATVLGKATHLGNPRVSVVELSPTAKLQLTRASAGVYRELGVRQPKLLGTADSKQAEARIRSGARRLAAVSLLAGSLFFVVLLIGFAYEWKTGALDWVRALVREHAARTQRAPPSPAAPGEPVLSRVGAP